MTARTLACLLACVGSATSAVAQTTPAVFVHGFTSSGDTWRESSGRMAGPLALTPYRPDLAWQRPYSEQAAQLQQQLGSLPASTIAIGHSNGGVVARQWARSRSLAGLVTIGAPHRGAPLIGNMPGMINYLVRTARAVWGAGTSLAIMSTHLPAFDWSWFNYRYSIVSSPAIGVVDEVVAGLATLGVLDAEARTPVLRDMRPGSALLNELNAPANLVHEAGAVPVRVGIMSSAPTYGGVFRAISPSHADAWGDFERVLGFGFLMLGLDLQMSGDPGDPKVMDAAMSMFEAAEYLFDLDYAWCTAVSAPYPVVACVENDGVVPTDAQAFPGAVPIRTPSQRGPEHTLETRDLQGWVYAALANDMHLPAPVPPPPPAPLPAPPPPPPSGPAMQQNAAIRNCWDYADWGATYQESPDACAAYCAAKGANACEWEASSGGCWVEFGSGCEVVDGFAGWYAATLYSPQRPQVTYMPAAVGLLQILLVAGAGLARRRRGSPCQGVAR